jgi:tRNA U34 5-carboxymethylaminomethyl modifying GTPase MnmE/TrmE
VLVDLRAALLGLGDILGVSADDAVLDRIFATFCVGK